MRRLGWVMALVVLVVAGTFALFAGGREGGGSDRSDDPPLPPATRVSATESPGDGLVAPQGSTATARVRIEVYGQGSADLTYTLVKGDDVELEGVALPWAIEANVDPRTPVNVTAFSRSGTPADPDATAPATTDPDDTLLCRVVIDGVLAESLQRPGYTSCSASAEDLR